MNLNIDFYDAYSKVFNRICCYIIICFLQRTDEESCSIIDFDEAQVMTEQELFSKVEIISLQNKDDLILSNVSQIIVEEPYILIKDSKM